MTETALIAVLIWTACLGGLIAAAVTDVQDRRIPNRVVLLVLFGGLCLRILTGFDTIGISLAAAALVFVSLAVLAHYGLLGEGDVKLIAVVTLLVPPHEIGVLLLAIAVAGGFVSCIYIAARFGLKSSPKNRMPRAVGIDGGQARESAVVRLLRDEAGKIAAGEPMPYGLAILGGVAFYVLSEMHHVIT